MSAPKSLKLDKIHTLVDLFEARVAASPSKIAYRQYLTGIERWHGFSWNEIAGRVRCWQQALSEESFEPGDRIAIMSHNRPEWVAADIAALSLGLVVVALFSEDTFGSAARMLTHSGARLLIVEDPVVWNGLREQAAFPQLRKVVSIKAGIVADDKRAVELSNWLPSPEQASRFRTRHQVSADDLAVICYTSGTAGNARGVMLSHRNILSNALACFSSIPMRHDDVALSFLPLAHMFERTADYYHAMLSGAELVFSRGPGQLADDFREIRPTVIISVPRVFERFYGLMQRRLSNRSATFRLFYDIALDAGWRRFEYEQGRGPAPVLDWFWCRVDRWLGRKVLGALGGRMRLVVSGGAPLSPQIARTFVSLGLPLLQGYGLTEASPVVSTNRRQDNDPESVGLPLPGVETRRASNGELMVRGPNVMMGYWNDEEATAAAIDDEGWLATGDKVSRLQADRIYLIGRLKELIVMSNGEKAAPAQLEQRILTDPLVDQVLVIGEARPFLSALVVLNEDALAEYCARNSLDAEPVRLEKPLLKRFREHLRDLPHFSQIRRIAILGESWTPQNELLTATYKPRRRRILQRFAGEIEALYSGHYMPDDTDLNYHVDLV